ncbi:MAG TPA: hypothetical protein VNX22_04990, partial [Acidobacteriaceae bacterium]|nr:hypothetical protein [Acidobacteriaceae bacterium]
MKFAVFRDTGFTACEISLEAGMHALGMSRHQASFNGEPCVTEYLSPGLQQDFISTDLKEARWHIATPSLLSSL